MAQTKVNIDDISNLLKECAAEIVLPHYEKGLQEDEVFTKSRPSDLVTIADRQTEEKLQAAIQKMYPSSVFIGEEGVHATPDLLDKINDSEGMIWIADPIDGTFNYAHGKRHFAIMLACVVNGQTQHGFIYDVLGDEMTIATKGQGVFSNGKNLSAAPQKPLGDLKGFASMKFFPQKPLDVRSTIKDGAGNVHSICTLGCAGHEYLSIARGDQDFALYTHMKPWDHLAGALMVSEAGGIVQKWDSSPYTPQDAQGGIVVASGEDVMAEIHKNFKLQKLYDEVMAYRATHNKIGGHKL